MTELTPLETLYEHEQGAALPLPAELQALYGQLQFPQHAGRPHIIANFVSTLDGVVTLNVPGKSGGGPISGFNQHDRMLMGILRAAADAVIVGAGTLRSVPKHLWTAEYIYPPLADAYDTLRRSLGKTEPPLNVIVTGSGQIDLDLPVFQSGAVPALIVTTSSGRRHIAAQQCSPSVRVTALPGNGSLRARAILDAVQKARRSTLILIEAGPQLMGDLLAERCLDELFLTLAPQIAGRDSTVERPGLVSDKRFAPDNPLWARLVSIKQGQHHLFLRYAFDPDKPAS